MRGSKIILRLGFTVFLMGVSILSSALSRKTLSTSLEMNGSIHLQEPSSILNLEFAYLLNKTSILHGKFPEGSYGWIEIYDRRGAQLLLSGEESTPLVRERFNTSILFKYSAPYRDYYLIVLRVENVTGRYLVSFSFHQDLETDLLKDSFLIMAFGSVMISIGYVVIPIFEKRVNAPSINANFRTNPSNKEDSRYRL